MSVGEKNIMSKRIFAALICVMFAFMLCSCNYRRIPEHKPPVECCNEILRCLEEKDNEGLKKLFCPKIISGSSALNDEIDNAMKFFNGKVLSHANPLFPSSEEIRDGEWVWYSYSPSIHKIKTDKNKIYDIKFYYIIACADEPERIGISKILITDENGEKCKIGDFYYVNPEYSSWQ